MEWEGKVRGKRDKNNEMEQCARKKVKENNFI